MNRRPSDELSFFRIVEDVVQSGITQQEIGKVVGASLRTVQNWAKGESLPSGAKKQRLLDLRYIIDSLRSTYSDEGIEIWLRSRNRNLHGQRPLDLLSQGETDAVVCEAERVAGAM